MQTITINNTIADQAFEGLKVKSLVKSNKLEILSITLEKGAIFPSHESNEDAHLVLLEGHIAFHIEEDPIILKKQQQISFPKQKEHWVEAYENSKFLIIR